MLGQPESRETDPLRQLGQLAGPFKGLCDRSPFHDRGEVEHGTFDIHRRHRRLSPPTRTLDPQRPIHRRREVDPQKTQKTERTQRTQRNSTNRNSQDRFRPRRSRHCAFTKVSHTREYFVLCSGIRSDSCLCLLVCLLCLLWILLSVSDRLPWMRIGHALNPVTDLHRMIRQEEFRGSFISDRTFLLAGDRAIARFPSVCLPALPPASDPPDPDPPAAALSALATVALAS